MSSVRDRYDRDTLNALQSMARSLERIANAVEGKKVLESMDSTKVKELMMRYKDDGF